MWFLKWYCSIFSPPYFYKDIEYDYVMIISNHGGFLQISPMDCLELVLEMLLFLSDLWLDAPWGSHLYLLYLVKNKQVN